MQTIHDLIVDALYETGAIPGGCSEVEVIIDPTPGASTITVEASWTTEYIPARHLPHPQPGEWGEEEGADTTEWDGESDPAPIVADLFGFVDDDVESVASVYLPADALDIIVGEYVALGDCDDPVLMFDPVSIPRGTVSNDYGRWWANLARAVDATPPRGPRFGEQVSAANVRAASRKGFNAGVHAGIYVGKAIAAAARMEEVLDGTGLLMWLTVPVVVNREIVGPGFSARLARARRVAGRVSGANV